MSTFLVQATNRLRNGDTCSGVWHQSFWASCNTSGLRRYISLTYSLSIAVTSSFGGIFGPECETAMAEVSLILPLAICDCVMDVRLQQTVFAYEYTYSL